MTRAYQATIYLSKLMVLVDLPPQVKPGLCPGTDSGVR